MKYLLVFVLAALVLCACDGDVPALIDSEGQDVFTFDTTVVCDTIKL